MAIKKFSTPIAYTKTETVKELTFYEQQKDIISSVIFEMGGEEALKEWKNKLEQDEKRDALREEKHKETIQNLKDFFFGKK